MKEKLKKFYDQNKLALTNAAAVVGVLGVATFASYQQKASENKAAQHARDDLISSIENHFNTEQ